MENEIFKTVEYNGAFFEVGNYGTLLTKCGKRPRKISKNSSGYLCYTTNKLFLLHRIVATAFCDNTLNKKYVNHIDGNKENNRADNLEWVTKQENELHSVRVLGNKRNISGLKENWLNPIQRKAIVINNEFETKEFNSLTDTSKYLKVTITAVSNVLNKRSSTCKGYSIDLLETKTQIKK